MKLTRYGIREWGGGGIVAMILIFVGVLLAMDIDFTMGSTIICLSLVAWLCLAAFFRSPFRVISEDNAVLVSPADGVIRDIEYVDSWEWGFPGEMKMCRIGIFLSILDVHLNRVPAKMTVEARCYKPGKYLDARHQEASKENESMMIRGTAEVAGLCLPVGVRQISGAIARRIICRAEVGSRLNKGAVYGMIKFGSRTELFVPLDNRVSITVKVGDKAYAGSSIVAEVKNMKDNEHEHQ